MRIGRTAPQNAPARFTRSAPPVSQIPEGTEYKVFCGAITANDLLGAAEHGIIAAVSLPAAIKRVQSTTRHKARGYWTQTYDPVKVNAALANPNIVLVTKDEYARNPAYKPR